MLPISDRVLPLEVIAEYLSRETAGVRTMSEIHDELLSAFWRNELAVVGSNGRGRIYRRRFLSSIRLRSEHPGFAMVDSANLLPQATEEHPDGSVTIDITKYIVLDSGESGWTDHILEDAYRVLAEMSFEDFHDLLKPGIRMFRTTREALAAYCDLKGYGLPRFWFRDSAKPRSFGGRPSVMRQIAAEMTRRAEQHGLAPKLREEAKALHDWAKANIDEKNQLPQPRAIENAVRDGYNKLRSTADVNKHKT
jgi:hypothetical protein